MTNESKQQLIVWWVMWAAFQVGIFMIYYFLGGTHAPPASPSPDSPVWLAGLAPFFASMIVRWILLPRVKSAPRAFPLFFVGIATAEATCFVGVFVFSAHQQLLFAASVLGIFQFIPFFARRFFPDDDGFPRA
jgi:hypothetical protein